MNAFNFIRREWLALVLMLVPTVLVLFFWSQLPERLATHWGLNGEVNGSQTKTTFLWFTLGLNVFVYTLLAVVPYIDPKPESQRLIKPLRTIRVVVMAFTAFVLGGIVLNAAGYSIDIMLIGKLAPILLYLVIGNLMAKFPPNYFAGIRTPWTLESPEVWRQVHRVASKLWVASSLILLLFVFRLEDTTYYILFGVVTAILVFVPMGHSYILYKKLEAKNQD